MHHSWQTLEIKQKVIWFATPCIRRNDCRLDRKLRAEIARLASTGANQSQVQGKIWSSKAKARYQTAANFAWSTLKTSQTLLGAPSKHHKHCLEHPQNITNIAWSTLKTSQPLLGAPSKHHNHCLEHPQNTTNIAWSTLKTPQTLLGAPSKHHKLCWSTVKTVHRRKSAGTRFGC